MNHLLYEYSLCSALSLMLFFGAYFLLGKTPDRDIFDNYRRSRRIMGTALLVLSANYLVHVLYGIRFRNHYAAILMNLSTYCLCYWLFSSALTTLLQNTYLTCRRFTIHLLIWLLYTAMSATVLLAIPKGTLQTIGIFVLAAGLFAYGFYLARRLILTYRRTVRLFDDTCSDDVAAYIRWLSVFTYWAAIFGIGCGLLTFLPDDYILLWILSSIPFYIYLFCSYQNYLLFYERVEQVLEKSTPLTAGEEDQETEEDDDYENIAYRLADWMKAKGYTRPGITIEDLSNLLDTNRTYLSRYIKETYHASFRDWMTGLRLTQAQHFMLEYPEWTMKQICEISGFQSLSHFTRVFTEKTGCSPAKWRKQQGENE